MTQKQFFKIALPIIMIPALVVLILPVEAMHIYVDIIEPLTLLVGAGMALWVSFIYRKQLKTAFTFLSVFLLMYALAVFLLLAFNPVLLPVLEKRLDVLDINGIVSALQFVNYAILLFFCINLLRVVNITTLNKRGWILFGITVVLCFLVALYPVRDQLAAFSSLSRAEISSIVIRILDALLIIVLAPVTYLYVQFLRTEQHQSFAFTVIIFGIVCATIFDFIFQFIITLFPGLLSADSSLYTAIPEAIFIFGYLVIAIGLYAHHKQDQWGFQAIDKLFPDDSDLTGDLE